MLRWLVRKLGALGLSSVLLTAHPAVSADIRVHQLDRFDGLHNGSIDVDTGLGQNMGPDGEIVCNLGLSGPIARGDLDQLKRVIGRHRADSFFDVPRLCLNSPGGSYGEGLAIAQYLMEHGIGTAVPADAECYSACAIIFMGGSFPWKGELNRFLHIRGVLGFHAPYLPGRSDNRKVMVDENEVRLAFSEGIKAMSAFMQLGVGNDVKRVVPELMQEMMAQGPSEFFFVDTVGKAIRFRIHLYGIARVPPVDDAGICNACANMNYGAYERYGRGGEVDLCKGLPRPTRQTYPKGVRLTNDVAPRGGSCSVDVELDGSRIKSWSFVNDERSGFGDGLELAYWFLLPPNTRLAALATDDVAVPSSPPAPSAAPPHTMETPSAASDREQLLRRLTDFVVRDYLGHGRTDHENRPDMYAPRVVYYQKGEISLEQVMIEKRAHYRRWPTRAYELIGQSLNAAPGPGDSLDISFRYRFDVSNRSSRRRGIGLVRLGVALVDGRFVIVRESGEVERRN